MPVVTIAAGGVSASIDSDRGGRLASLRIDGRELLLGPPDAEDRSIRWGCFLMAPWPGRVANAAFEWRGEVVRLQRTHGRHAIHGLTWRRQWIVDDQAADRVALSCALPLEEWPMGGVARQRIQVVPDGIRLEAEIEADAPMPAALGWHPWFLRRGSVALRVDGDQVLERRRMIPTGTTVPLRRATDLRAGPTLGRRRLDDAYVGVRPPIEIAWPDLRIGIATEPWLSTVVVHTPANAICVEPQTAWPDALSSAALTSGTGLRALDAGERLGASCQISVVSRR